MARPVSEIYEEIQQLSDPEKDRLLRALVAELDGPPDSNVEKAWLDEAQRRYLELEHGRVKAVPGEVVFERLRTRLRE
ncbi:MAG: addiction module protein [Gammaproteobacteria bacterium]|nr:addiction module protein [Gammaproteobacteria bacterium]